MSRSLFDFSKHELKITENDSVKIYEFKRPDTTNCMLVFINCNNVLTVTGDLGNWVFCREFHPTPDGFVSGSYWDEKLEISSVQKAKVYDSEETAKLIKEFKDSFEDSYGREMNEYESEWVEELENNVEDEHEYIYIAYRRTPSSIDCEQVPFGKKRHVWLNAVYDGFDAMCSYLKNNK